MLIALTRAVSASLGTCELTHLSRAPIDVDRARAQHRDYEAALAECGCHLMRLAAGDDMPDSVFVEDVALVFDELAVITRPGAESRRPEIEAVANALGAYRRLRFIEAPGTMDGGDVLVVGRSVYVGQSRRTNDAGIDQLRRILQPHGYSVVAVSVTGCLHLKSAVTDVGQDLLLINSRWVPLQAFGGARFIDIDPREPYAANAVRIGECVIYPAAFPRTRERLEQHGVMVRAVDASEVAKAEGAVTCCSLIFQI
jgi:dimethylargininase